MKLRRDPKIRKLLIIIAAAEVASKNHYLTMTRKQVAERAGVSKSLVTHYFKKMSSLKNKVVKYGIENNITAIIEQAKLQKHPLLMRTK